MIFGKSKVQHCTSMVGNKMFHATIDVCRNGEFSKIKLDELHGGWVVLFFYPADFTFVCPTELFELTQMYDEFKRLGVEVISVSTDSLETHKDWSEKSEKIAAIKYLMGSDVHGEMSKKLGVYSEHDHCCFRATVIIDPSGVIRVHEVNSIEIGRSAEELLRKIQALDYVRMHPDELCPASWKPGQKTLNLTKKL